MENEKCNGWSNYATWRIALEIFDGYEEYYESDINRIDVFTEHIKEYAYLIIFDTTEPENNLANNYAEAFLSDVNWYEIAQHLMSEKTNQ